MKFSDYQDSDAQKKEKSSIKLTVVSTKRSDEHLMEEILSAVPGKKSVGISGWIVLLLYLDVSVYQDCDAGKNHYRFN